MHHIRCQNQFENQYFFLKNKFLESIEQILLN